MTGVDVGILGTLAITGLGVIGLLIKTFVPNKKDNPGNRTNNTKVDHALMLKSLERIELAIKEGFKQTEDRSP